MNKVIKGTVGILLLGASMTFAAGDLERGFQNPPDSAKPQTWWHWMSGNVTKEGITADLESMKRVGLGGAEIFEVGYGIIPGPIKMLTPEWYELHLHAAKEAQRLGLDLGMCNCPGYCGSGGPWIKPEQSAQKLVWSEAYARGPGRFEAVLDKPTAVYGFYEDFVLLALPSPEGGSMAAASPKFTVGLDRKPLDAAQLTVTNGVTWVELAAETPSTPQPLTIEFPAPFAARSLSIAGGGLGSGNAVRGKIEASDDGINFKAVTAFILSGPSDSVNFDVVSARFYRVWGLGGQRCQVELSGAGRIEGIASKALYTPDEPTLKAAKMLSSESSIPRGQIVDLSAKMDKNGKLVWEVPQGDWTLLRIGRTTTGSFNHPVAPGGWGLACDKLSKEGVETHFAAYLEKLLAYERAAGVKAMKRITVDSWESGSQNWTPRMREEFRKRMGYDLLPFLAVITGRVVESPETSERFLWDFRRTVADLLVDNYATRLAELSRQHGLELAIEGYTGPFDSLAYAGRADIPQGEFWKDSRRERPVWAWTKQMASAAHIYGKPVAAAEAFTASSGKGAEHPFLLKPLGDEIFTLGINRMVLHTFTHQPWLDRKPGMTYGPHGSRFERSNTWWEQSRAWMAYLARCQYLLQQGRFVADIACLMPERSSESYYGPTIPTHVLNLPAGFDHDAISPELLLQMKVVDGRLTLPSGMSYRVLMLPQASRMRLAQLRKIRELVAAGAVVSGPPPLRTPSLADGPDGDAEVRRIADELWGDFDGVKRTEQSVGKGKVVWGASVMEVQWIGPDFSMLGGEAGNQLRFIHRKLDGKDIYFLAHTQGEAATYYCTFRDGGRRPELWHPDSGQIERVGLYENQGGQTRIPIRFEPYGSVFVVFNDAKPASDPVVSLTREGVELVCPKEAKQLPFVFSGKLDALSLTATDGGYRLETIEPGQYELKTASGKKLSATVGAVPASVEIAGEWEVSFPKGWGAPERVKFPKLISWPMHPEDGVKHFSGTATYRRQMEVPAPLLAGGQRLYLDLGQVEVMAEVKLNGKDLGILWKPPYRVDITEAVRVGVNEMEVRVVNLWVNRLIGDERLPEDTERIGKSSWNEPSVKTWPQWLLEGKPSPTGRLTFTAWKHWKKDDPLLPSGLLGPVRLVPAAVNTISSK